MIIIEMIGEFILAAWTEYLEKKCKPYDVHKCRWVINIIVSIIGVLGFVLIVFLLFGLFVLISKIVGIKN